MKIQQNRFQRYVILSAILSGILLSACREAATKIETVTIEKEGIQLSDSLITRLTFNNTFADSSKFTFPTNGSTLEFTTDRNNNPKGALLLNGSTQTYFSMPHDPRMDISDSSDMSVNLWVKFSGQQPEFAGILGKARKEKEGKFWGWHIYVASNQFLSMQFGSEQQGYATVRSNTIMNDNKWHMLTVVLDRKWRTMYWYIDGKPNLVSTNPIFANSIINQSPVQIGVERNLDRWFTGAVDDVRIYRRMLSYNEVQKLLVEN